MKTTENTQEQWQEAVNDNAFEFQLLSLIITEKHHSLSTSLDDAAPTSSTDLNVKRHITYLLTSSLAQVSNNNDVDARR